MLRAFWHIFAHEYSRHVFRRRFLFALFSLPLWIVFALAMAMVSVFLQVDHTPLGFIDPSGTIRRYVLPSEVMPVYLRVDMVPFADEPAARLALQEKRIQAYFVLPPGYPVDRSVRLVFEKRPNSLVTGQFLLLARINLLDTQPEEVARRIFNGPQLEIRATQEDRAASGQDLTRVVAPFASAAFLLFAIFSSAGYLLQAVVEEKENRTMEILVTSVSPGVIMNGKIAALVCVGLTQLLFWALLPILAIFAARAQVPELRAISLDPQVSLTLMVTTLPALVLVAALMAAIGASVTEARESQQMMSLISLLLMSPFFVMPLLQSYPGGPVALALSFFPLTAPLTLLLRAGISTVPTWQIALSAAMLILSAAGALWLAGRIFRLGMLRTGQRVRMGEVVRSIFQGRWQP
jgi:ABC-2 type transport system permease protein